MMINKENYEIYAIDFLENNLDKETMSDMIRFLDSHPAIKAELESMMAPVTMTPDQTVIFEPKSLLKKEENKRAIWIPTLLKYAAAITLLLSISSVWYLNNKVNVEVNASASITDTTSNNTTETAAISTTPIMKSLPTIKANKTTPINKKPIRHKKEITKTPKEVNTPIEELVNVNPKANEANTNLTNGETANSNITEPIPIIADQTSNNEPGAQPAERRARLSIEPIELMAEVSAALSHGSIQDDISIPAPPTIIITEEANRSKGSWLLNAITKKSDGTNIFAFEGVKRALTPTRLRDVNVDKASSDSPLKQFTND